MLTKIVSSPLIGFTLIRYSSFGIKIINSVLIANKLGLYYFGIYSFALMFLQYLGYTNLGIQYSYSVLASDSLFIKEKNREQIVSNALSLTLIVCLILIFVYFITINLSLFEKYEFRKYSFYLLIIICFEHFNVLFINIFRIYTRLKLINFYYILPPLLQLIVLFFSRPEKLLVSLFIVTVVASSISLIIFIVSFISIKKTIKFPEFSLSKKILVRGLYLLLYNLTFLGIILSARTLVSKVFSIEDFGIFNFTNSISSSVFLLLQSINFIFYPKLINVISKKEGIDLYNFVENIRNYYLTFTVLIIFLSLFFMPLLFHFSPSYKNGFITLKILLLAQLLINNSFGYSLVLVQKSKEYLMTIFSIISIILIISLSLAFLSYVKSLNYVALSVVIGVIVYNYLIGYFANKVIDYKIPRLKLLNSLYNFRLFLPILFYIFLNFVISHYYFNISLSFLLYLILNVKGLSYMMNKRNILSLLDKKSISI